MSDGALLESIITATGAKAEALHAMGYPFSGTTTDEVIVACEGEVVHRYAGQAPTWGSASTRPSCTGSPRP